MLVATAPRTIFDAAVMRSLSCRCSPNGHTVLAEKTASGEGAILTRCHNRVNERVNEGRQRARQRARRRGGVKDADRFQTVARPAYG